MSNVYVRPYITLRLDSQTFPVAFLRDSEALPLTKTTGGRDSQMTKFTGQVASGPERRDGRWFFSIWNTKANKGINCISSATFESENRDGPFEIKPRDEFEVIGEVRNWGTRFFDYANVLKKPNRR
jgi:hypothetical protein